MLGYVDSWEVFLSSVTKDMASMDSSDTISCQFDVIIKCKHTYMLQMTLANGNNKHLTCMDLLLAINEWVAYTGGSYINL